jgi:Ca2+-binding EF-hand superfamily protein
MSKDKVENIIKCLISHINNAIEQKKFKNKKMGLIGSLVLKHNILAVKFDENFENSISGKNKMFNNLRSQVSLDKNLDGAKKLNLGNFPNIFQTSENLKARNSLVTQCYPSAKKFLKNKYNIIIDDKNNKNTLDSYTKTLNSTNDHRYNFFTNTNKFFTHGRNYPFKFLNDVNNDNSSDYTSTKTTTKKSEEEKRNNPLFKLDNSILKSLSFFKGSMIKDSKELDVNKTGSISKEKAIYMLMKNIPELKFDSAKDIIEYYFITDQIDYMKLIALLIKGSKNCFLKKKGYFDFTKFLFKNTNINFNINRNFNFKNIIRQQKNKKLAKIAEANKDQQKLKELESLENARKINEENNHYFHEEEKCIERNLKELYFISDVIPKLKLRFSNSLEQKINFRELLHILKDYYEIYYQKEELEEILKFIEIKDIENFSLKEFIDNIKLCKLISQKNDLSKFSTILKTINDVIYMNGGEKFLFDNDINKNKNSLNINIFVRLLKDKCSLDIETLKNAFYYIVKTNRDMTREDYMEFFAKKSRVKLYDEQYFINMMKKIILVINEKFMTSSEYFDRLTSYNESTQDKVISRINWVKYLHKENFDFSAEELDHFFDWIDTKKDNVIDIDEFNQKYQYTIKPLTILKNIIHNNKLDIEDLAHRMGMEVDEIKKIDYPTFVKHLKKLDYILPESFIHKIFEELKQSERKINSSDKSKEGEFEYVSSKKFLDEINYVKPPEEYKSFTKNYIETIKSKMTYEQLKKIFEKFDQASLGTMTKLEFVKSIAKIFPEFNDDDHMRFIRIMDLLDKNNKVIYPELLNIIFYGNPKKQNDKFTKISEFLLEKLNNECQNDINRLMYLIENNPKQRISTLNQHKPLTLEQVENFFKKENVSLDKKSLDKLDIDSDGYISYDDLYSILFRYKDTLYFKYYNNGNTPNINLFTKDSLSIDKIRILAKKILVYMKNINLTPYGLFKKFDKDDNGLISNIDFNQGLKKYLNIDAALADPFFAYLDFYNIGMLDFETFMTQLTEIDKGHLSEKDRKNENEIISKIRIFILKNKDLSDTEIFQIMDKDVDGIISTDDLIIFAKENLDMAENSINRNIIERVMMTLSLTKNLQVGFNDISEFIKLSKLDKQNMNLKEVFNLTASQNLSQNKKNVDWIDDVIERFGLYINEKYENIEQFFNETVEPGSNKFKFSDFIKFHESHYDLFNHGFHLSKDELLSIYTSLDSQKKD